MAKILVAGATGLLGVNLVWIAKRSNRVIAVAKTRHLTSPDVVSETVDLSDRRQADRLIDLHHPDWIVNCAAMTDVDYCESNLGEAFRVNCDLAGNLAQSARRAGASFLHVSTDAVFDGRTSIYREDNRPSPVNTYGASKLAGEQAVNAIYPESVIVRTNFFGWGGWPRLSLAEFFLSRLEQGGDIPGFKDQWISPLYVSDLADLLLTLCRRALHGIFHVPGRECLSKLEFGRAVAREFEFDPARIRPTSSKDAGLRANRPVRLCLSGDKAESALAIQLPTFREGLERMRRFRESGELDSLRRMQRGERGGS